MTYSINAKNRIKKAFLYGKYEISEKPGFCGMCGKMAYKNGNNTSQPKNLKNYIYLDIKLCKYVKIKKSSKNFKDGYFLYAFFH